MVDQPFAFHGPLAVNIIAQADQRLVVTSNARRPPADLHQPQRVNGRGNRLEIAHAQKFFGQGGIGAQGGFAITIKDLDRNAV